MPALVKALNSVDFPTFGKPTIPHFKLMAASQRQAGKCMRSPWCIVAAWLALACSAAVPGPRQAVVLNEQQMQLDAQEFGTAWLDPRGTATIEQIVQGTAGAAFVP